MNFVEWGMLSEAERKRTAWHRKPHMRTATLFTIVMALFILLFVVRVDKNETKHLNRKPTIDEAYSMAQLFVKDKLKLPASADFTKSGYNAQIDTATNTYNLNGFVNTQGTDGHFVKQEWTVTLKFTGGDWANRKSWLADGVTVQ